jgi:two-component system, chemotaxis family, chemotaxis protein CheV
MLGSRRPQVPPAAADDADMSQDLLNRIDQRTRLAGHNRLALLLFRLGGRQLFGVNVFKVQEVLRRPGLFQVPHAPQQVLGAADIRGRTVPVIDLGAAIGHPESSLDRANYLVVTEFNRSVQGFLVSAVERIVNIAVEDIKPPPEVAGESAHLTAVTRFQGEMIQILDVEKVLADVAQLPGDLAIGFAAPDATRGGRVLVVDDSRVARNQIQRVVEQLGLIPVLLPDGKQALDHLKGLVASGVSPSSHYLMVISDIEMPAMDGYTLTTEIRRDARLADLFVLLHTSLSGIFNNAMVERVGANAFVAKYSPDDLAERVVQRLEAISGAVAG